MRLKQRLCSCVLLDFRFETVVACMQAFAWQSTPHDDFFVFCVEATKHNIFFHPKGQTMSVKGLGDNAIFQICVIVDDLERYTQKYCEIFGLETPKVGITAGHDETQATYDGKPTDGKAKIVCWQLGQVQFELLQPIGGPSAWQDFLDQHGVGVHHIAFRVKGSNEVAASFGQYGIDVTQQGLFTGLPRGMYTYLDTQNALGTTVELLEFFDEA